MLSCTLSLKISNITQQQWKLKQNFVFSLLNLILNLFSYAPKLPLIPKVRPSPNIKNLSLRLSV